MGRSARPARQRWSGCFASWLTCERKRMPFPITCRAFREASPATLERLLRVLAYVRKEADDVPDYLPGGLVDDQREIRAVIAEFRQLFDSFKAWRLRFQVPGMWV